MKAKSSSVLPSEAGKLQSSATGLRGKLGQGHRVLCHGGAGGQHQVALVQQPLPAGLPDAPRLQATVVLFLEDPNHLDLILQVAIGAELELLQGQRTELGFNRDAGAVLEGNQRVGDPANLGEANLVLQ